MWTTALVLCVLADVLLVDAMEYCNLGSSDLRVSKVCLGTMTWGQQNTPQEGVDQLQYAFSQGVNFLDTAEIYPVPTKSSTQGDTDRVVARWLKTQTRSEVVLASKVAGNSPQLTYMPGRGGAGTAVTAGQIRASVESSLLRLETPYIDLLQIHWPDRYVPLFGGGAYNASLEREAVGFEEQLQALEELVKEGKVRHLGLSNETPYGVMKFAQVAEKSGSSRMVSIQNSYSLLVRSDFENGLTEVCSARNENVGLLAYSPLAGGILTGKYAAEKPPAEARLNLFPGYMGRYKQSLAQSAVAEYSAIAEKHGLTPSELALAWCYKQPHVASTIIGATSLTQLKMNLGAFGKQDKITDEVVAAVEDVYRRYRDPAKV